MTIGILAMVVTAAFVTGGCGKSSEEAKSELETKAEAAVEKLCACGEDMKCTLGTLKEIKTLQNEIQEAKDPGAAQALQKLKDRCKDEASSGKAEKNRSPKPHPDLKLTIAGKPVSVKTVLVCRPEKGRLDEVILYLSDGSIRCSGLNHTKQNVAVKFKQFLSKDGNLVWRVNHWDAETWMGTSTVLKNPEAPYQFKLSGAEPGKRDTSLEGIIDLEVHETHTKPGSEPAGYQPRTLKISGTFTAREGGMDKPRKSKFGWNSKPLGFDVDVAGMKFPIRGAAVTKDSNGYIIAFSERPSSECVEELSDYAMVELRVVAIPRVDGGYDAGKVSLGGQLIPGSVEKTRKWTDKHFRRESSERQFMFGFPNSPWSLKLPSKFEGDWVELSVQGTVDVLGYSVKVDAPKVRARLCL